MRISRRRFITTVGTATLIAAVPGCITLQGEQRMYGIIGKMISTPGQRDALISILLEGVDKMPGCLSYIVAKDTSDLNLIWVTEVWDSEASHKASLELPEVKSAISRAMPMLASFGDPIVTMPAGGHGLIK